MVSTKVKKKTIILNLIIMMLHQHNYFIERKCSNSEEKVLELLEIF